MKSNCQSTAVANAVLSNTFSLCDGSHYLHNRIRVPMSSPSVLVAPKRSATAGVLHNLQNYTQWLLGPTCKWTASVNFPFLVLISRHISGLSGVFLVSWLPSNLGCTQQAYRPCTLGHPQDQRKSPELATDLSGFMDRDLKPWSKALELRWKGKEQDVKARSLKKGSCRDARKASLNQPKPRWFWEEQHSHWPWSSDTFPVTANITPTPHTPLVLMQKEAAVPRGTIKSEEVGSGPIFFFRHPHCSTK